MDTLSSKSEEQLAKSLISMVPFDHHALVLAKVADTVMSSNLPKRFKTSLILRCLNVLIDMLNGELFDDCFVKYFPHEKCGKIDKRMFYELWELPTGNQYMCFECGEPLYTFYVKS